MTVINAVQLSAIVLVGLLAGLLYGYDCSVIKGLGNLPDREYLHAFQSINKAIVNPYFLISFIGSLLLLSIATWLSYKTGFRATFYFLMAAAVVYIAGVICVTAFGNIPLNNLLLQFDIANASAAELSAMRQRFEPAWNLLHHIRTYAAMTSFILATASLIVKS